MCRHAIVTFLERPEEIRCVDLAFRPLVEAFHAVPYCASFGVSCAGHLGDDPSQDMFYPQPYGNLTILIAPEFAHIARLHDLIGQTVAEIPDAKFECIQHVFGPRMEHPIQTWQITAGDNNCLAPLGDRYSFGYLKISEHQDVFEAARRRYAEIDHLWVRLTQEVRQFCRMNGFSGKFDVNLDRRVRELVRVWNMAVRPADLLVTAMSV